MKKIYQQPRVRIVEINDDDLIATSNTPDMRVFRNATTDDGQDKYEEDYEGWGIQW